MKLHVKINKLNLEDALATKALLDSKVRTLIDSKEANYSKIKEYKKLITINWDKAIEIANKYDGEEIPQHDIDKMDAYDQKARDIQAEGLQYRVAIEKADKEIEVAQAEIQRLKRELYEFKKSQVGSVRNIINSGVEDEKTVRELAKKLKESEDAKEIRELTAKFDLLNKKLAEKQEQLNKANHDLEQEKERSHKKDLENKELIEVNETLNKENKTLIENNKTLEETKDKLVKSNTKIVKARTDAIRKLDKKISLSRHTSKRLLDIYLDRKELRRLNKELETQLQELKDKTLTEVIKTSEVVKEIAAQDNTVNQTLIDENEKLKAYILDNSFNKTTFAELKDKYLSEAKAELKAKRLTDKRLGLYFIDKFELPQPSNPTSIKANEVVAYVEEHYNKKYSDDLDIISKILGTDTVKEIMEDNPIPEKPKTYDNSNGRDFKPLLRDLISNALEDNQNDLEEIYNFAINEVMNARLDTLNNFQDNVNKLVSDYLKNKKSKEIMEQLEDKSINEINYTINLKSYIARNKEKIFKRGKCPKLSDKNKFDEVIKAKIDKAIDKSKNYSSSEIDDIILRVINEFIDKKGLYGSDYDKNLTFIFDEDIKDLNEDGIKELIAKKKFLSTQSYNMTDSEILDLTFKGSGDTKITVNKVLYSNEIVLNDSCTKNRVVQVSTSKPELEDGYTYLVLEDINKTDTRTVLNNIAMFDYLLELDYNITDEEILTIDDIYFDDKRVKVDKIVAKKETVEHGLRINIIQVSLADFDTIKDDKPINTTPEDYFYDDFGDDEDDPFAKPSNNLEGVSGVESDVDEDLLSDKELETLVDIRGRKLTMVYGNNPFSLSNLVDINNKLKPLGFKKPNTANHYMIMKEVNRTLDNYNVDNLDWVKVHQDYLIEVLRLREEKKQSIAKESGLNIDAVTILKNVALTPNVDELYQDYNSWLKVAKEFYKKIVDYGMGRSIIDAYFKTNLVGVKKLSDITTRDRVIDFFNVVCEELENMPF